MQKAFSILGTVAVIALAVFAGWSKFERREGSASGSREGAASASDEDQIKWIGGDTHQNVGNATDVVAFMYDEFNDKVFCLTGTYFESNERREFIFPFCPNTGRNESATAAFMLAKHYYDSGRWKEKYTRNLRKAVFEIANYTCTQDAQRPLGTILRNFSDMAVMSYSGVAVALDPDTGSEIFRFDLGWSDEIPSGTEKNLCWPVPNFPSSYNPKEVFWTMYNTDFVFR